MATSSFARENFSFITTPTSDIVRIIKQHPPGQFTHFEVPFSILQQFVAYECDEDEAA